MSKNLVNPTEADVHKAMFEVANLLARSQHQRTVEDIGVEPMTLSLQS